MFVTFAFSSCARALEHGLVSHGFSSSLVDAVQQRFERLSSAWAFAETSRNRMDRRLPLAGVFLSLVLELKEREVPFERVREVVLSVAEELVRPTSKRAELAKRWVGRLATSALGARLFDALIERSENHPKGFRLRVVSARDEGFVLGFDIVECGICKLFEAEGAAEYTKLLCEVDYLTSQLAGLTLQRSGTLATGASACDFRYLRALS